MSPSRTLDASKRSAPRATERSRFGSLTAYLAAPLWALQAVIWFAAPKVQELTPPFAITKPVHFALFWLSVAGAVAFSAASAAEVPRTVSGLSSRVSWWAQLLGRVALCLATVATIAIGTALIPTVEGVAISLMTALLNGALVVLALSLSLSVFLTWRVNRAPRSANILVTATAAATGAMIVAILASGSDSVVGLYAAMAVAALNGTVWFCWGRASAVGRTR